MAKKWSELRRNQQYVEQAGRHMAGVLREVGKLRELDPTPCEGYDGALSALEDGARILGNLAAALHYAMARRTGVEQYGDYLMQAKGAFVTPGLVLDLTHLLPPSRRYNVN